MRIILDLCEKEPEFITAIMHIMPDRPEEVMLYELWHGTREDFARVQHPKPYRSEYMQRSKRYVEHACVEWNVPVAEWGTAMLKTEGAPRGQREVSR